MCPRRLLLNPEVLAPGGLCCPAHHRLATSSASLTPSPPFPVTDGYRMGLWPSRIILPRHPTFRTFAVRLSRIAAFNIRREPGTCIPQFLRCRPWPSGRCNKPLALHYPLQPTSRRNTLSTVSPFAFATALLFVRLPWLVRLIAARGFYIRASNGCVTTAVVGYRYGATLGPAPTGLSPASLTASLAAQHPSCLPSTALRLGAPFLRGVRRVRSPASRVL